MAQPYDGAVLSTLALVSDMFNEVVSPDLLEPPMALGGWTSKTFNPKNDAITGDGKTYKIRYQRSAPATATRDMLAEFGDADPTAVSEYRIRFNQSDQSASDFGRISAPVQVSIYDIQNKGKGAIIDLVETLVSDFKKDIRNQKNLWRNVGQTGVLCLVNGTKKNNDAQEMALCSAYTTGATSFRANIDNGPIARLSPGMRVDVYSGSTLVADRLKVTDVNPFDVSGPSVGFEIQSGSTIANCDGVADNTKIVIYNSFNQGPITLEDWMSGPTATSESWIGGIDRTSKKYRQLIVPRMRYGSTAATIGKTHLDDLMIARGYLMEDDDITVIRANPELDQTLRNQIEAAAFITMPGDTERRKRFAQYGTSGFTYQSPNGIVSLQTDPLMLPDRFDAYCFEDWYECTYGPSGVQIMPGDGGMGNWFRMASATAGGGRTVIFRMEAMQLFVDRCQRPQCQARVLNLQP